MLGCGGNPPKYPARPSNCEVAVYQEPPSAAIDNIGMVYATCDESIGRKECERQLKEETCKLGGDVVWDVPDEPRPLHGKLQISGHAAHTRAPGEPEVDKRKHRKR